MSKQIFTWVILFFITFFNLVFTQNELQLEPVQDSFHLTHPSNSYNANSTIRWLMWINVPGDIRLYETELQTAVLRFPEGLVCILWKWIVMKRRRGLFFLNSMIVIGQLGNLVNSAFPNYLIHQLPNLPRSLTSK